MRTADVKPKKQKDEVNTRKIKVLECSPLY